MREYFKQAAKEVKNIRSITGAALLGALSPVLNLLTITINQFLQISFTSLTHAMCGYLYGPVMACLVGGFVDIMKYMIKPTGAFFIGFTINEMLVGLIYGLMFYKKKITWSRVIVARLIVTIGINLLLTPLWLSIMYGKAYTVMVSVRIVKNIIMMPIDMSILYTLLKFGEKNIKPKMVK
ncbi:MAG: folate family ECF transporter S component [Oscillospiraceae bacterium]